MIFNFLTKHKKALLGSLLVFAFFITTPQAHASMLTAPADITSCGDELTTGGTYTLTQNIGTPGATCLTISSPDVVIVDGGNGYIISGNIVADALFSDTDGFSFTVASTTTITGNISMQGNGTGGVGTVTFAGSSQNRGNITGDAVFNDQSYNNVGAMPGNGLVGLWKFNEDTIDYSDNGNNGTFNGTESYDYGIEGSAANFDGSSNDVQVENVNFDTSVPWTYSLWIHPNSIGTLGDVVSEFSSGIDCNVNPQLWVDWSDNFVLARCSIGDGPSIGSGTSLANKWSYITFVYDGSTTYSYVNGQLFDSYSGSWPSNNPARLTFGASRESSGYFNGKLDNVAIYNRALTNLEISQIYSGALNTISGTVTYNGLTGYNSDTGRYYISGQQTPLNSSGNGLWNSVYYVGGVTTTLDSTGNGVWDGAFYHAGSAVSGVTASGSNITVDAVDFPYIYGDSNTIWTFQNSASNSGTITGDVLFTEDSYNNGIIIGDAVFNDQSYNNTGAMSGDGLVAHYTFDGNVNDSSGNGNNGNVNGNASYVSGVKGQAFYFDDSTQINISDFSYPEMTFSAWIKRENLDNPHYGGTHLFMADNGGYGFYIGDGAYSSVANGLCITQNGNWGDCEPNPLLETTQWVHVAGTYDSSNNVVCYYVNGQLDQCNNSGLFSEPFSGNGSGYIGIGGDSNDNNRFLGAMDDVTIYNRALSDQEVFLLSSSGTITGSVTYNGFSGSNSSGYFFSGQKTSLNSNGNGYWNGTYYINAGATTLSSNGSGIWDGLFYVNGSAITGITVVDSTITVDGVDFPYTYGDGSYNFIFQNGATNSGDITGNATFLDTSTNNNIIEYTANFYDSSINNGTVYDANVYFPHVKSIDGVVLNTTNYLDYPGAGTYWYSEGDTDWNNYLNWWADAEHTVQAEFPPDDTKNVVLLGAVAPIVNLDNWTAPASIDSTGLTGDASAGGVVFASENNSSLSVSVTGNVTFNGSSINISTITGDVVFNNSSYNNSNITGNVTFNNGSSNYENGLITGDVIFTDDSLSYGTFNLGTINGNVEFNGNKSNYGTINGNVIFNDASFNESSGNISGDATFTASSFDSDSYYGSGGNPYQGSVGGTITFSSSEPVVFNVHGGGGDWYADTSSWVFTTPGQQWIFGDGPTNMGTIVGSVTFNSGAANNTGGITGDVTFNDGTNNTNAITGNVIFNNGSYNASPIYGNATFNSGSYNNSDINGDATFNDSSFNQGTVTGTADFEGSSFNYNGYYAGGYIWNGLTGYEGNSNAFYVGGAYTTLDGGGNGYDTGGYANGGSYAYYLAGVLQPTIDENGTGLGLDGYFYYYGSQMSGVTVDLNANTVIVDGVDFPATYGDANTVWTFQNGASNSGSITGTVSFLDSSYNTSNGYITGNASFNPNSDPASTAYNDGQISGEVDVYYPVSKPINGYIESGIVRYHGYGFYFNDDPTYCGNDINGNNYACGAGDGDWANIANWWTDVDFTIHPLAIPDANIAVTIVSNITQDTSSSATAESVTFIGTAINHISITTSADNIFQDGSSNGTFQDQLVDIVVNGSYDDIQGWGGGTISLGGAASFTYDDIKNAVGSWSTANQGAVKLASYIDSHYPDYGESPSGIELSSFTDSTLSFTVASTSPYKADWSSDNGSSYTVNINQSASNGSAGHVTTNAIFAGDNSNAANGTVDGTITRQYTEDTTTTRNFTSEGGRSDWIIAAYNSVVNLAGATYNRSVNIFKAFSNSVFQTNLDIDGGASVTPELVITSPTAGTITKLRPNISWGNASTCEYQIDGGNYTSVSCTQYPNITKPSSGSHIIFFKATDSQGNLTEKSVAFTYDNASPIDTDCSTPLDEARTYYLTANTSNNCVATANVTLQGNASSTIPGYTLSGNYTSNGNNITFKNITVSGNTTGNPVFQTNAVNSGTVTGNATFDSTSYNSGTILGNAQFNAYHANASSTVTVSNNASFQGTGKVSGLIKDNVGATITTWNLTNGTNLLGTLIGIVTFTGTATNNGTVMAASVDSSSSLAGTLLNNLVGWWKLDGNLTDSSGNGHSITNSGVVTFDTGKVGNGAVFNGSNYLRNTDVLFSGYNNMTFSAWFKYPAGVNNGPSVILNVGGATGNNNQGIGVYVDSGNRKIVFFNGGGDISIPVVPDTWGHLVITGTKGTGYRVYFNGTFINSRTTATWFNSSQNGFFLGRSNQGQNARGTVDDVAIYNRVLTDQEISTIYQRGISTSIATTTFTGDTSSSTGLVTDLLNGTSSPITRIFTSAASTTRNFLTEAGHNNWVVVAQGAVVDLTNAVYSFATNVFKGLLGGYFIANPNISGGVHPVPIITVSGITPYTGTTNTKTAKWNPVINWDTATTCTYSYNSDYASSTSVTCSSNYTALPRPTSGVDQTVYLRGIDTNGNIAETSIRYLYDNTLPIATDCSTPLDESTRQYYYLTGNVAGNCTITANNVELRGSTTTPTNTMTNGFKVTGNIIADATSPSGNGLNITLNNIIVTGTTTASGGSNGGSGGTITVKNAKTGALVSNGATYLSGNGGNGGTVTVATSTTGIIYSNGGDGSGNGGAGGVVTVTNAYGTPFTTPVNAVGGDSKSCGDGGDNGRVSLVKSLYGAIRNTVGLGANSGCPLQSHTSGVERYTASVIGSYVRSGIEDNDDWGGVPYDDGSSVNNVAANLGGASAGLSIIRTLSLPINTLPRLSLPTLPTFGEGKGSFSFISPLQNFLFSFMTPAITTLANPNSVSNALRTLLANQGIKTDQAVAALNVTPKRLTDTNVTGLFTVKGLTTKLTGDKQTLVYQKVNTETNKSLTISLIPTDKKTITATFNGKTITFNKNNTITLTTPSKPGTYFLKTTSSPIPLAIVVTSTPTPEPKPTTPSSPPSIWSRVVNWFSRK